MEEHSIRVRAGLFLLTCLALQCAFGLAQSSDNAAGSRVRARAPAGGGTSLATDVQELRAMVDELRQENEASRAEMKQLREQLERTQVVLEKLTSPASAQTQAATSTSPATPQNTPDIESRVDRLEETQSLLNDKINEQYQTKVEAASKYHVRLSGIVLMNAFRNHGASDNFDFPDYAIAVRGVPQSGFGATLRQSEIGLEVFGPTVIGAKTSANVHMDFAGGFPSTPNGVDFGIARLKTASVRFDWASTSIVAGQDSLFISPLSPTSFASLATPAFAYAGNLWGWIPQLRVEHQFNLSDIQKFTIQAGILDNLTWEVPINSFYRYPTAGEQTGQPAYAARTAWSTQIFGHELSAGVAGYYSRQDWSGRHIDGWAGMGDWEIPITQRFTLSGKFYRGRAAGGLGAGIGQTVLYGPSSLFAAPPIRGVDSAGGWAQMKWQITPKIEMNGVIAEDDVLSHDVIGFATSQNNYSPILGRNRGAAGHVIFRPRSDLILATEFRRLRTYPFYENSSVTNQLNLAVGVLF
jgi:outer membrane murein-binding lipoprotein Lpp